MFVVDIVNTYMFCALVLDQINTQSTRQATHKQGFSRRSRHLVHKNIQKMQDEINHV
jgi:hypothetical protein